MVELIQPPDPRTLLPPLLACLPLAFVSPRPPPALLSLLSPILRQRVQFLASSGASVSATDSWLRLLSWKAGKGEELQSLVDGMTFEPHPVSGEIELPDDMPVTYKRIDEETLHARIVLPDYCLNAIYVWCPNDEQGGGPGWRVTEVLPRGGSDENEEDAWSGSMGEANTLSKERLVEDALRAAEKDEQVKRDGPKQEEEKEEEEEDDDAAYWAQYDATPGATPATKTPAPNPVSSLEHSNGTGTAADSYFARYGDVQPALDNHDPAEEQSELGPSSLNGDLLASLLQRQTNHSDLAGQEQPARTNGFSPGIATDEETAMLLNHPRPSTDSSVSSDAVARLEQEAENQSSSEMGVRQHISSNIKSLFRLAKSTGIPRAEFQSLVQTELELLSVSDE